MDDLINYGKSAIKNAAKTFVKGFIKKNPYIIAIIAGLLFIMLVLFGILGIAGSAEEAESQMQAASGAAWEQFIRYLHQAEGGGTITQNSEGVDCYTVNPDGGGGAAVGYGVDIATHGDQLRAMGYSTEIGALIPVSVVDQIEEVVVKARYTDVQNLVNANGINLTQYQIFALTSRTYNYGFTGGTGQATSSFKYPSTLTFVEAYKQYYSNIDNDEYYGDYTKTDFENGLYTQYMTALWYLNGDQPEGWVTRRQSEWCLFQTGYYGWGLQNGNTYPVGFDEYWQDTGVFYTNLNNEDGTANEEAIQELEYALEKEHNLVASGKGFNNWKINISDEARKEVTGKYHGFKGVDGNGRILGNNNLSVYQCTWWANGRASEYLENYGTVYKSYPTNEGNGGEYFKKNRENGWFNYGSTPKPNSLLSTTGSDGYGHVMYIEAVDYVNEYYYASEAGSGEKWRRN